MTVRKLLTTQEAADILGLKKNTLEIWRSTKRYDLPYVKNGGKVMYEPAAIEAFIAGNRVTQGGAK